MTCIISLPYCWTYGDTKDGWFAGPTAAYVIPYPTSVSYKGMSGTAYFKDGYGVGLEAGRTIRNFKLYLTYDYTQARAKGITINTPFGQQSNSDTDLFASHTIMANADIKIGSLWGFRPFIGGGAGLSIDQTTSSVCEVRGGLERKFKGGRISIGYAYRIAQGQINEGNWHIKEPSQSRFMLAWGRSF